MKVQTDVKAGGLCGGGLSVDIDIRIGVNLSGGGCKPHNPCSPCH